MQRRMRATTAAPTEMDLKLAGRKCESCQYLYLLTVGVQRSVHATSGQRGNDCTMIVSDQSMAPLGSMW